MHFLRARDNEFRDLRVIGKHHACVTVKRVAKESLQIDDEDPIGVMQPDTQLCRLPDRIKVFDAAGKRVIPTHGFWVSTETLDPFHLLTDWDGQ